MIRDQWAFPCQPCWLEAKRKCSETTTKVAPARFSETITCMTYVPCMQAVAPQFEAKKLWEEAQREAKRTGKEPGPVKVVTAQAAVVA